MNVEEREPDGEPISSLPLSLANATTATDPPQDRAAQDSEPLPGAQSAENHPQAEEIPERADDGPDAEENASSPPPAKGNESANARWRRRVRRATRNQYIAGLILMVVSIFFGIGVQRYLDSQKPSQMGDVTEIKGFSLRPDRINCQEIPAADPQKPEYGRARTGPYKKCDVAVTVVNNTKEASSTPGISFVLYVADNRFPSEGFSYSRELFPNESTELTLRFSIPPNSTPTKLVVKQSYGGLIPFVGDGSTEYRL